MGKKIIIIFLTIIIANAGVIMRKNQTLQDVLNELREKNIEIVSEIENSTQEIKNNIVNPIQNNINDMQQTIQDNLNNTIQNSELATEVQNTTNLINSLTNEYTSQLNELKDKTQTIIKQQINELGIDPVRVNDTLNNIKNQISDIKNKLDQIKEIASFLSTGINSLLSGNNTPYKNAVKSAWENTIKNEVNITASETTETRYNLNLTKDRFITNTRHNFILNQITQLMTIDTKGE